MKKTGNDAAKEFLGQHTTNYGTPPGAKADFAFSFTLHEELHRNLS
jgi:hypothetical protein